MASAPSLAARPAASSAVECADWVMPQYQGKYICDWLTDIKQFKREDHLDEALELSQGCMDAMVDVAKANPDNAMEYYVKEVVLIQQKQGDHAAVVHTIQGWLDLGIPAPRDDYRVDLLKRLAKAQQFLARANGEDPSPYVAEWQRLKDLEAEIKARPGKPAAVRTGETKLATGVNATAFGSAATRVGAPSNYSGWVPSPAVLAQRTFVAVDFETANSSKASACQVALIKIENGQVVNTYTTLLRPPEGFDSFELTHIHGLTLDMVAGAPQWHQIAPHLKEWTAGLPVYAHNATFDRDVWCELDAYFGLDTVPRQFYCSYRTAQRHIDLPNYKLPTVTKALVPGVNLNHHAASSDAEACARIIMALQNN
ncbi:hypothetical protein CPHO_09070 [Corynebacterium phocae]|uniref:Exonuclease domain-containing protein n=1 Tax=Corynebacterium phocae TaxID=161895 RepID=A0A1L7D6H4_9CORY|nr:hypothetical protein CPHO_09070 [Corynebacterium phocae]